MGPIIRPAVLTRNGLPPAPNSPQGILLVHDPSRQTAEDGPGERATLRLLGRACTPSPCALAHAYLLRFPAVQHFGHPTHIHHVCTGGHVSRGWGRADDLRGTPACSSADMHCQPPPSSHSGV